MKALLRHADPEVCARVERVCRKTGLVKSPEVDRRREEIFRELAFSAKESPLREELVRELLDLGPRTAALVARELHEGKYAGVAERPAVIAPESKGVTLRVRNTGALGCWFRPERHVVVQDLQPFGIRPGNATGWGGGLGGIVMLRQGGSTPEDRVVAHLAGLTRVPPGGTADFGTSGRVPGRCGVLNLTGLRMNYAGKLEAEFQGVTLKLPETDPQCAPGTRRIVLGPTESEHLAAVAVRQDDGWALEITALDDRPAAEESDTYDNFWWAALGENEAWLASGAMESTKEERAALKKGELRRVPLRAEIPEGSRHLWLGYDENFKDVQAVADPVSLEENKK